MARYDPHVIQQFADRLYRQAAFAVVFYPVVGFLIGAMFGLGAFGRDASQDDRNFGLVIMGLAVVICTTIGIVLGMGRALTLRMHAQISLCQRQIEYNTRPRQTAADSAVSFEITA